MRRKIKKKRPELEPDIRFESAALSRLINHLMRSGKKSLAERIVYEALDIIKEKTKSENPLLIMEEAIKNTSPLYEVRSRRVGGANYQVPREVRPERRLTLAFRWIVQASRAQKGAPMAEKLAQELIKASKNEGAAVKKKTDTHRMAEANRAFAHFAW